MADVASTLRDPNFQGLPVEERRKVLSALDPNFGQLHPDEQNKVLGYTDPHKGIGLRALDYATDTISNIPSSAGKLVSNAASALMHPVDTLKAVGSIPVGLAEKAGIPVPKPGPGESDAAQNLDAMWDSLKQRYGSPSAFAETLRHDPVGVASDVSALVGGVGGLAKGTAAASDLANLPRVASAARTTAKAATAVSDAVNPMNAVTKPAGYVAKAAGKGLIKSALGLGGKTERYGATPATAALENTSGLTPEAIKASAQARLADLNTQLEGLAANSPNQASLAGARKVIEDEIAKVKSANGLADDLTPMQTQLSTPRPGFTGATYVPPGATTPTIAELQHPTDFLGMKRQFGDDFTKFDAAVPLKNSARALGNRAYGQMSSEFNRAVPGAAPVNQEMQSLIPVRDAAQRTAERAGPVEKAIDRATRPTGGLAATLFGLHTGGVPGAMLASGAQETLSSPTARIAAARAAYGTGNALTSPITSRVFNNAAVAGSIPRFARGGIVRKPTLAVVGEAGPEAIVPLGAPPRVHMPNPEPAPATPPPAFKLHPMHQRSAKQRGAIFEAMHHHQGGIPPRVSIR